MLKLATIAAAALLVGGAAPGPTVLPVPAFRSVELNGGGEVILRHGPRQRVTLLNGSTEISRIEVRTDAKSGRSPDRLVIDACRRSCNGPYDLKVEVVTPNIEGVSINGGGKIRSATAFPRQGNLGAAIRGGGLIDVRSLPARSVGAAINGGGSILTTAEASLQAAINGGGSIRYRGNPRLSTAVNGGGAVTRAD